MKLYGIIDNAAQFIQKHQLCDKALWAKFVDQFRIQQDGDNKGWRGEYFGKMMRGGALVYAYTKDEELYNILTDAVRDMLTVAEDDGRVSSYVREKEFTYWDIWCRKYVLLGLEYYLDICRDDALKGQITEFIKNAADYILAHVGEGKIKITMAAGSWLGVNSSSILEPMVRLYKITNEQRYLDFAKYIVECGGAEGVNIFEAAYRNELLPYQYGVSKAYEIMSCFEGLLEYYYVTGIEKYKIAVINFARGIIDSEISIIGCSGVTHELFDHTRNRQTVPYDIIQETCVTVTWMKFCSRLLNLTGESVFADEMEKSLYNAYLGALNTEHRESEYMFNKIPGVTPLPSYLAFDSYSPLVPLKRGRKVGGNQFLSDLSYYGCCACIGAAGIGVVLQNVLNVKEDTVTINFFEKMDADLKVGGKDVHLKMTTDYPLCGKIKIEISAKEPVRFTLKTRNPAFTGGAIGYRYFDKEWSSDIIEFELPMEFKAHYPEKWDRDIVFIKDVHTENGFHTTIAEEVIHNPEHDKYVAITKGPLVLAADSRTGKSADSVFDFEPVGKLCNNEIADGVPCPVKYEFTDKNGEKFYLVDYMSAGKDWETLIAAWLPTSK